MNLNLINKLKQYDKEYFKDDLLAGLTVGAVALPQNMAYALVVGINPIYGIYTSIVSMIISSIFGASNYLVVGPSNVMAIAISSTLSQYKGENYLQYIFILTFLIGVFQLIMAFIKLGRLVNYISHPVIVGLTNGIALIIAAGQLSNIFGIDAANGVNFFTTIYNFIININSINIYSLLISTVTISVILIIKKYKPNLPAYLISVIIAMLLTYIFKLNNYVEVVNDFQSSLPSFNMIKFEFSTIKDLASSALSLAILGFIQVVSIVKSLGSQSEEKVEMNEEFISQGLTNVVCSFFNSFAITGSFTNSFINYEAGAKTRLSEFITAIFFIIFLLLFAPLVKFIPVSSLAAIVLLVATGMVDIEKINRTFNATGFDAIVLTATFITTILLPRLDYAIYFGVLVSIILVLRNTSDIEY
ncbi:MAG: SulP family inorganic anion transporter, partial [Bacillota bacterium]